MSTWSLTYQTRAITVSNIYQSFYLQDGGKNQLHRYMEQNYVTVTLCIENYKFDSAALRTDSIATFPSLQPGPLPPSCGRSGSGYGAVRRCGRWLGVAQGGTARLPRYRRRHAVTFLSPIFRPHCTHIFDQWYGYDARYYFNVRSKADTSRLNLPHGTNN